MTFATAFWVCMLVWLVFGFWTNRNDIGGMGGSLLSFVLFFLLGWKVFGSPVHG